MRWLDDRYRLDTPVGRGGMAVVWRGYDAVLCRVVAIKMLPDLADDDRSHERLRAEALAAAQLSHACIASVYDYGETPAGWRRRAPFIVMEYVDGQTLAARLASGPLPWREAVRVCAGIADALTVAHASGLVHRDIKPGNVILSGSTVKVVDFGIATSSGGNQSESGGVILGTQAYMAPEQAADTPALPASDVHALGLVLRDCLTGKRTRTPTLKRLYILRPHDVCGSRMTTVGRLCDERAWWASCGGKPPSARAWLEWTERHPPHRVRCIHHREASCVSVRPVR